MTAKRALLGHEMLSPSQPLRAAGVTSKQIRHRLQIRRLHQIHSKVYALQPRVFGRARYRAAVYARGRDAAPPPAAAEVAAGPRHYRPGPVRVLQRWVRPSRRAERVTNVPRP